MDAQATPAELKPNLISEGPPSRELEPMLEPKTLNVEVSSEKHSTGIGRFSRLEINDDVNLGGGDSLGKIPRSTKQTHILDLATLPAEIAASLKPFDFDGDGAVDPGELTRAADMYTESKKNVKKMSRFITLLFLLVTLLLGVNAAIMFALIEASKETTVDSSGTLLTKWGDKVHVASTDTRVNGTIFENASGEPVRTASTSEVSAVNSCLSNEAFKELRHLNVISSTGAELHLLVHGFARLPRQQSSYGTVVVIITSIGQVEVDGTSLEFSDAVGPIFEQAGFKVSSSSRHLLGIYELQGFFNTLPTLVSTECNVNVENLRPTFPSVQHITYTTYTSCFRGPEMSEIDACEGLSNGIVSAPSWASSLSERFAITRGELWQTEEGAVEVLTLPASLIEDLVLVKVHDVISGNVTQFQHALSNQSFCGFVTDAQEDPIIMSLVDNNYDNESLAIEYTGKAAIPGTDIENGRRFVVRDPEGNWPGLVEIYEAQTSNGDYRANLYAFWKDDHLIWWTRFESDSTSAGVVLPQKYTTFDTLSCPLSDEDEAFSKISNIKFFKQTESPLPRLASASIENCKSCFMEYSLRWISYKLRNEYSLDWFHIMQLMLPISDAVLHVNDFIYALRSSDKTFAEFASNESTVLQLYLRQHNKIDDFQAEATQGQHRNLLGNMDPSSDHVAMKGSLETLASSSAEHRRELYSPACCSEALSLPIPLGTCNLEFAFDDAVNITEPKPLISFLQSLCMVRVKCSGIPIPSVPFISISGESAMYFNISEFGSGDFHCGHQGCLGISIGCPDFVCPANLGLTVSTGSLCLTVEPFQYMTYSGYGYMRRFNNYYVEAGGGFNKESLKFTGTAAGMMSVGFGELTNTVNVYNYVYNDMKKVCNDVEEAISNMESSGNKKTERFARELAGLYRTYAKVDHYNFASSKNCNNADQFIEYNFAVTTVLKYGLCFGPTKTWTCKTAYSGTETFDPYRVYIPDF